MTDSAADFVSIIIPVYQDDAALQQLLANLASMIGDDPHVEIVVVATGDSNATQAIVDAYKATLLNCSPGRGTQMNFGASAARGDILWFLHADAEPPIDALSIIRNVIRHQGVGGWFQFRFQGIPSKAKNRLAALINWRARHGIAYGDQGLFFSRVCFEKHSGFQDVPLFEEVQLVKACKTSGHFLPVSATIGVNDRRWQQDGWIRRTLSNRALAIGHACGIAPEKLARWYSGLRR